jgi:predicted membrane-bound spermidine synthase
MPRTAENAELTLTEPLSIRPGRWRANLLSFSAGYAIMAVEMTSLRVLAPYFGTSAFVWAVVIGVVMVMAFAGNLLGGRAGDRGLGIGRLCRLHLLAALLVTLSSQAATLSLDALFARLPVTAGTLSLSILLAVAVVSLPVVPLAATVPWLVGVEAAEGRSPGASSGRLAGIGTLGGLLGTFLPVLLLVPRIGTRWTFASTALLLVASAVAARPAREERRAWRSRLLASLAVAPAYLLPVATPPGTLLRAESPYNTIFVTREAGIVDLLVNDRWAIQSRLHLDPSVLPDDVWGLYLTAPVLAGRKERCDVLLLGLGAGGAANYFSRVFPSYRLTGVEIDGAILDAGRKHFGLGALPMRIEQDDARAFLRRDKAKYDVIVVDAFAFPYLPAHLSTAEFMGELNAHLAAGGVVLCNVGRFERYDEVVEMIARTGLTAFRRAWRYRLGNGANTLLYFSNGDVRETFRPGEVRHAGLRRLADKVGAGLEEIVRAPGEISTDDRPLSEWLTHRVVLRAFGVL